MRLHHLATQLGCELVGDGEVEITGVAGMEHAVPGQLTFLANLTYAPKVKQTKASAILVSEAVRDLPIASLVSANPYVDFARALALFYQPPRPAPGVHPMAYVAASATLGENCSIGPFAVVGEFCRVGDRVTLQNGVVVGGDGFGFAKRADGTQCKIVQSGLTILEDDVEIQSLTSIDRATVGETRI